MRIQHLAHSCLLVETAGQRILADPGTYSPRAAEVTELDAVLVTHQHPDHVDPEVLATILAANPEAIVIAEPEAADAVADVVEAAPGARAVAVLAAGEAIERGDVRIAAVGGRHAIIHPDIPRVGNVGFVISAPGEPTLGITGDSLEPVVEFHGIDVLAFAVVAPWSKMRETIDFLREVRPRLALPVHDAIVSPQGRPIFINQCTNLAPEGTEVRDWPSDGVVEVGGDGAVGSGSEGKG